MPDGRDVPGTTRPPTMRAPTTAAAPSPCVPRRPLLPAAVLGVLAAVALPAVAAATAATPLPPSDWQAAGPAGAGAAVALEVDGREPDHVYLGTADGVFASRDGGASWRMSSLPGLTALAHHPAVRQRLYAVTQTTADRFRLWRSDDRASSWKPLAEVEAPTGEGSAVTVHALAVDPDDPDHLFLGGQVETRVAAGAEGRLRQLPGRRLARGRTWRSSDAGDTLLAVASPAGVLPATALLVTRDGGVLAGTARGLYRSTDRGKSWRPARLAGADDEPGPAAVDHLTASSGEPQVLYAGTAAGGLLRSDDDGASWTAIDADLPRAAVTDLVVDPRDRRSLWASFDGHGVHATRGGPWRAVEPGLPDAAAPRHLALAPGAPARLWVATADGELYRRVPPPPECSDDADTLCLGGRFRVDVEWWGTRDGEAGLPDTGRTVPLGGDAGWFWFRDPEAPQVAVKLLPHPDGGPARVHVASLTDAGLDLRIFDVESGRFETWRQAPGEHGAATGVASFPASARHAGAPLWFTALPDGGCGGESIDLCLHAGRFRVQVDWRTRDGEEGAAVADRVSPRAGWFRFRHPDDPELFVDLADRRRENGHWWLSYATLSDAGFELTVIDEESGESVTWEVPPGAPSSHRDTRAMAGLADDGQP